MSNDSLYHYSENNLLENPQKYQMSPFLGKKFLKSYFKSREENIKNLEESKEIIFEFNEIIKKLSTEYPNFTFDKIFQQDNNTEKFLALILSKLLNTNNSISENEVLEKIIKKFEVKKRLFSSYDSNLNENSENYINLRNYILLSAVCLMIYKKSKNLRYLNTSLKLNDTISSQIKTIEKPLDKSLFLNNLQNEIQNIENLCKLKKVDLIW